MMVILATGASGGHLFPAVRVAEELRSRGVHCFFMGSFTGHTDVFRERQFSYEELQTRGLTSGNIFYATQLMIKAFFHSRKFLKENNPSVVIGFGGHGSFAVVLAASFLNIPSIIHEQNVVPGRANRMLSKFVRKVAVSFEKTKAYFHPEKTTLTGCPTHLRESQRDRCEILGAWGLKENHKTILVFGGSQGAQRINDVFTQTLDQLEGHSYQVIHITGDADYHEVQKKYANRDIPKAIFSFLNNMEDAYSVSDLVISRAGAVTVTELALFNKKAILIPYPYAKAHQKFNAKVLEETGGAVILEEDQLNAEVLNKTILELLSDGQKADRVKKINFINDASARVADLVLTLA